MTTGLEVLQVLSDPRALFRPRRPEPSYPDLPVVRRRFESTVPGVHLIGEVGGTPLIKLGLNEGFEVVEALAPELGGSTDEGTWDLVVVGAGAAGFAAMVRAHERGLRAVCLEADVFASTVQRMYPGKILFAEPEAVPVRGSVWFEECTREQLLHRWTQQWAALGLDIRTHERVTDVQRSDGLVEVVSDRGRYRARRVVLALGKAGNPRKAGVPGEVEHAERVCHHLADPSEVVGEDVVIYGGGDVACEAALALCDRNHVVLATIDEALVYPRRRNREAIEAAAEAGRLELHLNTRLAGIDGSGVSLLGPDGATARKADRIFEMIGAELPTRFFERVGIRLRSKWTGGRFAALAALMLVVYALYAVKSSTPVFPFTLDATGGAGGWMSWLFAVGASSPTQTAVTSALDGVMSHIGLIGHNAWYALLYTVVVAVFGLRAAVRWGRNDPHQRWRFASILFFQVLFFFAVEVLLVQFLGMFGEEYQKHYWRGWGIAQPFPLFYNTFLWWYDGDPAVVKWTFVGSGLFLTFVATPLFVRWQGMRFCTWICGCGGLAETLGDPWRHLSPKGSRSRLWEFQSLLIAIWAFGSVAALALVFQTHGDNAIWGSYAFVVDFWLIAVLPVGFYPFFGGKIWCRYWCPLANYMKLMSRWFGTLRIVSNDKCISCTQCSTYCQVGVDVMAFARAGESFDNSNSACIHCGICITVCPVDVLSFDRTGRVAVAAQAD